MGANFEFINVTTQETFNPRENNEPYYLWRNIDRGSNYHFKNH